jgi:hypothetical protein
MLATSWSIAVIVFFSSIICAAGPINPDPQNNKPNANAETSEPEDVAPLQQMDVTIPKAKIETEPMYFYPYDSSFSVGFGPVFLSPAEGIVLTYGQLSGTYVWQSNTSFHIESGLDATSQGQGQLWTGLRNNWHSSEKWRPFYSFGVGFKIYPERGLTTFLSLSNYFLRAALGVEYTVWEPISFRAEMFVAPDLEGRGFFGGTIGFAYGL